MQLVDGRLWLEFIADTSGGTVLNVREAKPPLSVVRAFVVDHGANLVHLHNVSGGVLGGDKLTLRVDVRPRAASQLTTTSATRVYRRRQHSAEAIQVQECSIGENALLEMLPDPIIPFSGAAFRQQSRIDLANGAGLFWWKTIAPGREARGEVFAYDRLSIDLEIRACGRPIALEYNRLEPAARELSAVARLGSYRYFSTFYICRVGWAASDWASLESELSELAAQLSRAGEVLWGVSTLVAHGLVVKALSQDGSRIAAGLVAFWKAAKQAIYGKEAVLPRKVY